MAELGAQATTPQTAEEKLERAKTYKQEGNAKFKSKDFKGAIGKYHRAILYTKTLTETQKDASLHNMMGKRPEQLAEATVEEATQLQADCQNNLAACLLQNESPPYEKIAHYCDQALLVKPSNPKALYRKGVALYHLNNSQSALEAFKKAQSLPGGDTDVAINRYLDLCEKKLKKQDQKLKSTYKKMFDSLSSGDHSTDGNT